MSARQGLAEMALFVMAAGLGVYGLGEGLDGVFESGQRSVLWLAVAAVALMVLARQMARVQDRSPRRARGMDEGEGRRMSRETLTDVSALAASNGQAVEGSGGR